jgi:hypothetical protein
MSSFIENFSFFRLCCAVFKIMRMVVVSLANQRTIVSKENDSLHFDLSEVVFLLERFLSVFVH